MKRILVSLFALLCLSMMQGAAQADNSQRSGFMGGFSSGFGGATDGLSIVNTFHFGRFISPELVLLAEGGSHIFPQGTGSTADGVENHTFFGIGAQRFLGGPWWLRGSVGGGSAVVNGDEKSGLGLVGTLGLDFGYICDVQARAAVSYFDNARLLDASVLFGLKWY